MAPNSANSRTVRSIQAPSSSGAEARKGIGTAGSVISLPAVTTFDLTRRRSSRSTPRAIAATSASEPFPSRDLVLRRDLVIVLGEHRKDPLLDGLGLAEQAPGLDAVFEGGLDGGGRLEIEGGREARGKRASRPGRRQTRGASSRMRWLRSTTRSARMGEATRSSS